MPRSRSRRKPRGSRGNRLFSSDHPKSSACDLMVLLPKDSSRLETKLLIQELTNRLQGTGFSHMALTHTIFGSPSGVEDEADSSIPREYWAEQVKEPAKKKAKTNSTGSTVREERQMQVKRRIHAVLENLSDVGSFLLHGPHHELLSQYDLVSVAPRNEAVFQSACASATIADIIHLDYTVRGMRLPYRIRPSDVQAVMQRNAAFEIQFAPALLNMKQRKALVQTCRELQTASLGKKPRIIFSSGDRTFEESDVGAMALRLPGDLSNLLESVLHFDSVTSHKALVQYPMEVMERAEARRWGLSDVGEVNVSRKGATVAASKTETAGQAPLEKAMAIHTERSPDPEDDGVDGFIAM